MINLTILFKLISISLFRKILVYVITKFQYALLSYYKDSKTTELIKTINNWLFEDNYMLGMKKCMNEVDTFFTDK